MGYLTTVTFWMDSIDKLFENKEEFADKLKVALSLGRRNLVDFDGDIKIHKMLHSSEKMMYLHYGNTVDEMSVYSSETTEIMQKNPDVFEEELEYMEDQVKKLRQMYEEYKSGSEHDT